MAAEIFDGFDHTAYEQEVTERWGRDAYDRGDRRWRSLSEADKEAFQQQQRDVAEAFGEAQRAGLAADSDAVQDIARRQLEWLSVTTSPTRDYVIGLGQLYVDDQRFTATYDRHGSGTAVLVRDALTIYAERNLGDA